MFLVGVYTWVLGMYVCVYVCVQMVLVWFFEYDFLGIGQVVVKVV